MQCYLQLAGLLVVMHRALNLLVIVSSLVMAGAASAGVVTRPTVLELFTSEGCSSCPPAEELVNELAQRPDVLPLSFHVDYWDGLGWKDRYSLASATERQRRYARSLRQSSVYTPQAIVDGSRDIVGSDRRAVAQALAVQRKGVATFAAVSGGDLQIIVGAGAADVSPAEVLLVGYLRRAISHIGRGENSGRTLTESNVVRTLQVLGTWRGTSQSFRASLAIFPPEVTDVAVLVQSAGQGSILGAVAQPIR